MTILPRETAQELDSDIVEHNERPPPRRKDWVDRRAVERMAWWSVGGSENRFGIRLNPVVSIASTIIIWSFVMACLLDKSDVVNGALTGAKSGITELCTWLYIGAQECWSIFIIVLYFSKYGKMKLGKDDEKPEHDTASWFMMLFAAGIGVGLFYFGVSEPVSHYANMDIRYKLEGPDERAQQAMNQVFFHWGLHAWVVYSIVGLTMAFVGYRKDLPITMRSCFYPLLGERVYGTIGDGIDILSICCTIFGVCCSLGLGVIDVSKGIQRLSSCTGLMEQSRCDAYEGKCVWTEYNVCKNVCDVFFPPGNNVAGDPLKQCNNNQYCSVKTDAITSCKTKADGIVGFEPTPINLVCIIWVITAIASISVVTGVKVGIRALSIICFSVGMFLWVFIFFAGSPWYFLDILVQQTSLYFQTIVQVGGQTDAYARHAPMPLLDSGASPKWMDDYTMFYWGWWISWSPFVGMFIAKISRGRTIREFINGALAAPAFYTFAWFSVFGGAGLKMQRQAESIGLTSLNSPAYLLSNETAVKNPLQGCNEGEANCNFYSLLSDRNTSDMWMDMVSEHFGFGPLMMSVSLIAILLYFVTSADSGSLVVDSLASNGAENPPIPQKLYWASTVGAVATSLILVGSSGDGPSTQVLTALQAASISSGLPYTIMLCFMCASLWKACKYDSGDETWNAARFFRSDLFNVWDVRCNKEWVEALVRTCCAVVAPTYFLQTALNHGKFKSNRSRIGFLVMMSALFYLVPLFLFLNIAKHGIWVFAMWWYLCFVACLALFRGHMRKLKNLDGDFFQDLFASAFMYPMVAAQLDAHFRVEGAGKLSVDIESSEHRNDKDTSRSASSDGTDLEESGV
eukprot:GEMP01002617.1.p1 GENE.GEMP01002617.1~~GEMP01002617.1.p1  ORF type:complete len:854 (-),score=153.17 GEMP01002617.1:2082-4643(-)